MGRGFLTSSSKNKVDQNFIFQSGPYFMRAKGLYLKCWSTNFNLESDVFSTVPGWVKHPFLPLYCWNDTTSWSICNAFGKYIDRAKTHEDLFSYWRIGVEVDLDKGLLATINLNLDNWSHIQEVDYDQLPFKCKGCHQHGHFERRKKINRRRNISCQRGGPMVPS